MRNLAGVEQHRAEAGVRGVAVQVVEGLGRAGGILVVDQEAVAVARTPDGFPGTF